MNTPRKPRRKKLTRALERRVIVEAGGRCPWCDGPVTASEIEIHHIDEDPSNNEASNLILVCRNHHGQIGVGLIPQWEVIVKKQLLTNPLVAERLGLSRKVNPPAAPVVSGDNNGVVGQTVHIGTFKANKPGAGRRTPTPGLIEADGDMRTYANYLVGRYIDWRKKGQKKDKRPFRSGAAHGILAEGFGSPTSVLLIPQGRFFDWIGQAQGKIDRTVFGKMNSRQGKRNYHSWEEHLAERHGSSSA